MATKSSFKKKLNKIVNLAQNIFIYFRQIFLYLQNSKMAMAAWIPKENKWSVWIQNHSDLKCQSARLIFGFIYPAGLFKMLPQSVNKLIFFYFQN